MRHTKLHCLHVVQASILYAMSFIVHNILSVMAHEFFSYIIVRLNYE
jgi:hypothetical protein